MEHPMNDNVDVAHLEMKVANNALPPDQWAHWALLLVIFSL